jgi:hypothetical protein
MRKWVERRVKLPKKEDKCSLINTFQTTVDAALQRKGITAQKITTNDQIYSELSNVIVTESQETFGKRILKEGKRKIITREITEKVREIHRMGKVIWSLQHNRVYQLLWNNPGWAPEIASNVIQYAEANLLTPAEAARAMSRQHRKELYQLEKRAAERDRIDHIARETTKVLAGQSSKRLAGRTKEHVLTPIITKPATAEAPEEIICNPGEVRKAYQNYF